MFPENPYAGALKKGYGSSGSQSLKKGNYRDRDRERERPRAQKEPFLTRAARQTSWDPNATNGTRDREREREWSRTTSR